MLCKILKLPRSTYYYESKQKTFKNELINHILEIFRLSRNNYGTRKIKVELFKLGHQVSRRYIGKVMKENCLVSNYTKAQFKPHIDKVNESRVANLVNRKFDNQPQWNVVVSDLTYVRVGQHWNYICILIDLFNREIIGYSAGKNKDAVLVCKAFASVKVKLSNIKIFHTDRGNEFKNNLIDKTLETFNIKRSLSMKGCPYDNAIAEATFKIIKTEFINNKLFNTIEELQLSLADYVNWFNNCRIHSSLEYMTPSQYKTINLKKIV